jgi:RNA polymerase sigma factor (sigma-70 family)
VCNIPGLSVGQLAEEEHRHLLRFLATRVRREDVGDLANEVWARLLALPRKDLVRDARAYLITVAAHLVGEYWQRERKIAAGTAGFAAEQATEEQFNRSPEFDAEAKANGVRIKSVLDELSPKCRAVVVLHRMQRMTYEEIARVLGISPSMVKKYLAIGLRHCCERLQDLR